MQQVHSNNVDTTNLSNIKFSIGDYIRIEKGIYTPERFGKIIEVVGESYKCLFSFVKTNSSLGGESQKIITHKEVMRPDILIKISEQEYQDAILKQKDTVSYSQRLNKYWKDSNFKITLLGDILRKDSLDSDAFKLYYKEIVLINYNKIFSLENLPSKKQQEILTKTMGIGQTHENTAKFIILTQQSILEDLSGKIRTDEIRIIKDICIKKEREQLEFVQGINKGLLKLDYTVEKGILLSVLGVIIIFMIPIFAPHFKIGSFIFGPLFTGRGIYILIKAILLRKRR